MYANDTSLYVIGTDLDEINYHLNQDLIQLSKWFKYNRLVLNVSKTNCMLICTPQKRLRLVSDVLDLYIDEICITNVTHQNVLGVTIDIP